MPTESQLYDAALRVLVRRKLDDGRLPLDLTKTIAVSNGSGNICLACDQTITVEQIEYQAFGPATVRRCAFTGDVMLSGSSNASGECVSNGAAAAMRRSGSRRTDPKERIRTAIWSAPSTALVSLRADRAAGYPAGVNDPDGLSEPFKPKD
jgi:hypothetical protein